MKLKDFFWDDYIEQLTLKSIFLIMIILIIFTIYGSITLSKYSCKIKTEMMGLDCNYTFLTGCMVKIDNNGNLSTNIIQ